MQATPGISCQRTRALVSSGLDGRLHDLERRFLEAHLGRCRECKSFADEAEWFTNLIRSAPLESWPVPLPSRRRRVQLRSVASVASVASAAVVLVVASYVALNTPRHGESEQVLVATALSQGPLTSESIRSLRRADLVSGRLSLAPEPRDSSLGAVKPLLPPSG